MIIGGKINEIEVPSKDIEIFTFKQLDQTTILSSDLHALIKERINKIAYLIASEDANGAIHIFQSNTSATNYASQRIISNNHW